MRPSTRVAVLLLVRVVLIQLRFSTTSPAVRLLWIGGYNTSAPDAVAVPRFVLRGSTWFREGLRRSCARLPFGGRFELTASGLPPHCLPVYRFVELLNREVFSTPTEARILIEWWRKEYNQVKPHSSLGYRLPAPQIILPTMVQL